MIGKNKNVWLFVLTTSLLGMFTPHASARIPCSVGQRGEVFWKGAWYPAQVKNVSNNSCYITYEGYDSSWDEWVEPSRFRAVFRVGQSVKILWKGQWYPGRILDVNRSSYLVTYDGYDSSWNEWVESARVSR